MRPAAMAALVALAGLGAPADALRAQAAPDSVTLHFAWPDSVEARVRFVQLIEREGDRPVASRMEISGELTMHVHHRPEGILVEHLDPLVTRFEATPPLPAGDPHKLVYERLGVPTPHYVIGTDGALRGVAGQADLLAALGRILGPDAAQNGTLETLGRELLNDPLLVGGARERWNAEVGLWLDAVLKVGEPTAAETRETNPMAPTAQIPYAYRFELLGMEPCDEAKPAGAKCARVGMISLPDPTEFNNVMNQGLAAMGITTMSFDGLAQHTEVDLLTDPATLLPRELTTSKIVEGILKEGESSRVFRRVDGVHLVFTYAER